ncbi:hypothetical protein QJQ45_013249 [Haematococcus lacustris]|nr:hypothetical protein QJQ45_013249 [Haematococcus lacustris]
MWCPVVAPRRPPQAPRSGQAATQPAASEPGPSTPQRAKRSKRTRAEPETAEPTQPTKGNGKAAKAKPPSDIFPWVIETCRLSPNRWGRRNRIDCGRRRSKLVEFCRATDGLAARDSPRVIETCRLSQNRWGRRNRVDCGGRRLKAADRWAETGETGNRHQVVAVYPNHHNHSATGTY